MYRLLALFFLFSGMASADVVRTIKNGQVVYESVPSSRPSVNSPASAPPVVKSPVVSSPVPYKVPIFQQHSYPSFNSHSHDINSRVGTVPCQNGYGSRPVGKAVPGC